jgi:cytochrome c-type biogenesis protein CcmH
MLLVAAPAFALDPGDQLSDPALEARAHAIGQELRCLVCQNQSIEDSDADLAGELRRLVRERVAAGDSDGAVKQYIVDRYGEFVLLRPILAWHTILLWAAAPALLIVGIAVLLLRARRRTKAADEPMTEQEQAALQRLTDN